MTTPSPAAHKDAALDLLASLQRAFGTGPDDPGPGGDFVDIVLDWMRLHGVDPHQPAASQQPERSTPVRYVGVAGVAAWLGVTPKVVSQWLIRYDNTPPHDADLAPGRQGIPDRGWLDDPSRRAAWERWQATGRPGQGAPGRPKRRRAASEPSPSGGKG